MDKVIQIIVGIAAGLISALVVMVVMGWWRILFG